MNSWKFHVVTTYIALTTRFSTLESSIRKCKQNRNILITINMNAFYMKFSRNLYLWECINSWKIYIHTHSIFKDIYIFMFCFHYSKSTLMQEISLEEIFAVSWKIGVICKIKFPQKNSFLHHPRKKISAKIFVTHLKIIS